MKLIAPAGEVMKVTDAQPDLLNLMRSSYGLLGVVYEVTIRVRAIRPFSVDYRSCELQEFIQHLPKLADNGRALKLYLMPFRDRVTAEFRRYDPNLKLNAGLPWKLRSWTWRTALPSLAHSITASMPIRPLRYFLIDSFSNFAQSLIHKHSNGCSGQSSAQHVANFDQPRWNKYTYSTWAFRFDQGGEILTEYFEFCRDYYRQYKYRCNLPSIAFRINRDSSALLSQSFDDTVLTLSPMSTITDGWEDFLVDFNEFCSRKGGVPVFNQTKGITPLQAERAFGDRLRSFSKLRKRIDPDDRLLNSYFMQFVT